LTRSLQGLRILGVEDGSFQPFQEDDEQHAILCGVIYQSGYIKHIKISFITVDGMDSTDTLLSWLRAVQVECILLGGITFAGFNIIDTGRVHEETGLPIVVYSGKKPDNESMRSALKKHFGDWRARWRIVEALGTIHCTRNFPDEPSVYFEVVGESSEWAERLLLECAVVSRIPEPIRVAGLIARGVSPVC
jgi:endonuclease V-like protein UPF0215 family